MGTVSGIRAVGLILLTAAVAGGAGCSGGGAGQAPAAPQPPPLAAVQFKLSVAVSGGGLVTDAGKLSCTADCAAVYGDNATVTLHAVPSGSQIFTGWTGDCAGISDCTLRMTRDLRVGAGFGPAQHTLAVSIQGQGSVSSTPPGIACPGTCSAAFAAGTTVLLSATPQPGLSFSGWSGACTGPTCQFAVIADAGVTALFGAAPPPASHQLSVSVQGSGTVTSAPAGISCPGTCTATFAAGTALTLSAAPASGSQFSSWSGACTGASGCQVSLAADSAVSATFTVPPPPPPPPPPPSSFVLTVAVQGTGTVTSTPAGLSCPGTCSASFAAGTSLTLSAAAGAGSTFSGWSGACAGAGTGPCAIAPKADSSAGATFASTTPAPTRLLTVAVQGAGTVTSTPSGISCNSGGGTCSAAFPTGSAVALTGAPATGSAFAGWSGACTAAYDCQVALASDTTVGAAFAAATPFSAVNWTFYGAQQGLPAQVLGVSADAGGNLWVAGGEDGLFVLRAGDTAFQRFTMADGLRPYGYMADGSAPPGTPYLKVISVAGGPAGTAYVGYAGKPPPAGQADCESNWDSATPDPSIYKSGDADKVTLVGNGIAVVHYDIFSGPNVVGAEPRGREKLCNILRIVYDPAQDAVWFGANHGFALGRASFQGAPACNGQLSCAGVWEHVHPAINGYPTATSTTLVYLTADYDGVAVDPVTHDTWFGGLIRTTKFHYATQKPSYWAESYFRAQSLTEDAPYISNRIDVWPDKVQEPAYPRPADRVDDNVSGIAAMQDGTAWVSSNTLGLARLDPNGVPLGYVKDLLIYPHLGAVAADTVDLAPGQSQGIWAGYRWTGGLVRIAGGSVAQISYGALGNTLGNSPVRDIQMQGTGSSRRVLVAFENGVVGVYSGR